ncbi:MAG TPA: hypothetical protein DEH78_27480 [Solibacterales bacterium]|nr:hypothetical protein [Bryobacterales bacterium]
MNASAEPDSTLVQPAGVGVGFGPEGGFDVIVGGLLQLSWRQDVQLLTNTTPSGVVNDFCKSSTTALISLPSWSSWSIR